MGEWNDKSMDGWVNGWMVEIDGCMDEWMNGSMNGWMENRWMDE